jgi:phospholipid transport system substrate-binding protein
MRLNGIRVFVALFALGVAAPQVSAAEPQVPAATPSEFITEAVDELRTKLHGRRKELLDDPEALYVLIDEVLLPRFDRKRAARAVLAKHWRTASEEQKARFIDAFYSTLVQRYATGVLDFELDRIKVKPFRGDLKKGIVKVQTTVELEDGTTVNVTYALTNNESDWKMVDVIIEGVSYIRSFRTEIDSEVTKTDLETVIVRYETEAVEEDNGEEEALQEDGEETVAAGDDSE